VPNRPPIELASIREWAGSSSRAFEELCYQLLREPGDLPFDSAAPIRTGSPDGGVEWYAPTPDGGEWGWQAKFIFDIDSLLSGMTTTVRRVAKERPDLTRLTFCIPWNLPAGTSGKERVSARQKYENKVQVWRKSIAGANRIDFQLIQGSDLLDRLALAKHRGRQWFWFNQPYLGLEQLEEFRQTQAQVAGPRYRPDLQVDLPIAGDLHALGFSDRYLELLHDQRAKLVSAARYVHPPNEGFGEDLRYAFTKALASVGQLLAALVGVAWIAGRSNPLSEVLDAAQQATRDLEAAHGLVEQHERQAYAQTASDADRQHADKLRSEVYAAVRLRWAVNDLCEFLESEATQAVVRRCYFLSGAAGTGKTHLLVEATHVALQEKRPAAVLFAARFGTGDLWGSIADQLGLPPLGRDQLLGALDAAAEACSPNGRRFVLMIDALNETPSPDFWARHLPTLRAEILRWPHLALVVSCRDTYIEAVDPDGVRTKFTTRAHPGFADREVEASHVYFLHYGLDEPRIPLLLPEFSVPLFLQFYCEALRDEGHTAPPNHHESRIQIFERFLSTRLKRVARRLNPGADTFASGQTERLAMECMHALLEELVSTGREGMTIDRAEAIAHDALSGTGLSSHAVLGTLIDEGLLNQEQLYLDGTLAPGIRVTFQAFADFLILRTRLEGVTSHDLLLDSDELRAWLDHASHGIREAASIVLPERFGVELIDFLEPYIRAKVPDDAHDSYVENRLRWLEHLFYDTLPYRSAASVTERSIDVLNAGLRHGLHTRLFDILLLLAPQPGHRLNGDSLHAYLSRHSLPERDSHFGVTVYHEFSEESSPAVRLARWAAAGPYPQYDPAVIELACIPLIWLLSSPNRHMRDWTTKALVQLLQGHPDVLKRLVERFLTVNDPYVVERIVTVAYGAALRCQTTHRAGMGDVARVVVDRIFGPASTPPADALLLDAARGLVEWAAQRGYIDDAALSRARPPYGLKPPGPTWSSEHINSRFEPRPSRNSDDGYWTLLASLFTLGDFGRYVVDTGLRYFSKVLLSAPAPLREPTQPARLVKSRFERFERTLTPAQRQLLLDVGTTVKDSEAHHEKLRVFHESLSPEQSDALFDCWHRPRPRIFDRRYPGDRACRWIFQRVIRMGWTPKRFGSFDAIRARFDHSGRSAHKAERFGKKYQWIAYHELLARVADNFHVDEMYSEEFGTYDGLYQINDREIDPSLRPVPFEETVEDVEAHSMATRLIDFTTFPPSVPRFEVYRDDARSFVADTETLPTADRIARLSDSSGNMWVLLDAHLSFFDSSGKDADDWRGLEQWSVLKSWFVPRTKVAVFRSALLPALATRRSSLTDHHGHVNCCYLGELGWRELRCPHRAAEVSPLEIDGSNVAGVATAEDYSWEGSGFDCSIRATVHVTAPSTFLQVAGSLEWSGDDASWYDTKGEVVAVDLGQNGLHTCHGLAVRETWLKSVLRDAGMALAIGVFGERRRLDADRTHRHPWLEFQSVGTYAPTAGRLTVLPLVVTPHEPGAD
jgi:hypothetical protein